MKLNSNNCIIIAWSQSGGTNNFIRALIVPRLQVKYLLSNNVLGETKVENGNDSYVPTAPITYNQLGCLNYQYISFHKYWQEPHLCLFDASVNCVSVLITNGQDKQICLCHCGLHRAVAMHCLGTQMLLWHGYCSWATRIAHLMSLSFNI